MKKVMVTYAEMNQRNMVEIDFVPVDGNGACGDKVTMVISFPEFMERFKPYRIALPEEINGRVFDLDVFMRRIRPNKIFSFIEDISKKLGKELDAEGGLETPDYPVTQLAAEPFDLDRLCGWGITPDELQVADIDWNDVRNR